MRVDLGLLQHRAQDRLAGGVADAGGEIADDQDDQMPGVLELPQLLEDDDVTEMDVGRRRVDAELDPQGSIFRASLPQALLESPRRQ